MIGVLLLHYAERLNRVGYYSVEVVEILVQERLYSIDLVRGDFEAIVVAIIVLAQFVEDLLMVEILTEDVQVRVFDLERVDLRGVGIERGHELKIALVPDALVVCTG